MSLDRLYKLLYSTAPCPKHVAKFDQCELRLYVQACGIAYEQHFTSLVEDRIYDVFAQLLGDSAATAMDWQSYPPEAHALAAELVKEHDYWAKTIVCFDCWNNPCECFLD